MNKEEQIDALEAQVKQQHPSWNNDDIRNQAVRMFYMDTTTVLEIIKMIDAQIWNKVAPNKAYHISDAKISALHELKEHLQEYIEGQVSAMENSTGE